MTIWRIELLRWERLPLSSGAQLNIRPMRHGFFSLLQALSGSFSIGYRCSTPSTSSARRCAFAGCWAGRTFNLFFCHAAIAIGVVPRKKWIWLVNKFTAADSLVIVVIEISHIGSSENRLHVPDLLKFLFVQNAVSIFIGKSEQPIRILFPLLARKHAIVIGVPARNCRHERIRYPRFPFRRAA
jgi:hypothetical protein